MSNAGAPLGNKNNATGTSFKDALRYEIAKVGRSIDGDETALVKGMRALAKPLVEAAITDKNLLAVKEAADRIDGRSNQAVTVSAPDGGPVQVSFSPVCNKQ